MYRYQDLGKVFRKLRQNRHISLKQATGDLVSVSQLSRFERGESDLSVGKFLTILGHIHVEVKEFMDEVNDYQHSENIAFMSALIDLEYKRDIAGFRALLAEEQDKYRQKPEVYRYYLNQILLQGFICKCDATIPFPQSYIDDVTDYLFTTEHWNIYELILIGNLYLFIDIPLLHRMGQEILKRRHYYRQINTHKHLVTITMLNIWETCLHRKALDVADYYRRESEKLIRNETKVYEKTIYLFLDGLHHYQSGQVLEGIERMRQAIQVFEWVGCPNMAHNYKADFKRFVG